MKELYQMFINVIIWVMFFMMCRTIINVLGINLIRIKLRRNFTNDDKGFMYRFFCYNAYISVEGAVLVFIPSLAIYFMRNHFSFPNIINLTFIPSQFNEINNVMNVGLNLIRIYIDSYFLCMSALIMWQLLMLVIGEDIKEKNYKRFSKYKYSHENK